MNIDDFKSKVAESKRQNEELEIEAGKIQEKIHANHVERRALYKQYIDEHFPYHVGDRCKYTFMNRDGDSVTRIITITEVSGYMCSLNSIIIYYTYENTYANKCNGRIDYVSIDGRLDDTQKLELV